MNQFTTSLDVRQIEELLDPDRGVTTATIQQMTPDLVAELCHLAEGLVYEPAKNVVTKVEQNFRGCSEFADGSVWKNIAAQLEGGLESSFRCHNRLGLLATTPLSFTDLALQYYPETRGDQKCGIGIHRDQSDFINLVVVLLLHGDANFYICQDRKGNDAVKIDAEPGQLIVMRGGGFAGGNLSRPLHYVGPIDARGRLSFGLRQVPSDPAAMERIRALFSGDISK